MKGLTPAQLESLGCQIMLSNTYHLGSRPGPEVLQAAGGLHAFMGWKRSLLTVRGALSGYVRVRERERERETRRRRMMKRGRARARG